MTPPLPACPARFSTRKAAILAQLARPDDDYTDASPKGAVDEGVRPLLDVINGLDGFVTTSSCAGRVAVFLEGRKSRGGTAVGAEDGGDDGDRERTAPREPAASAGGKGGGGKWLYVSHDPLVHGDGTGPAPPLGSYVGTDWTAVFGLRRGDAAEAKGDSMQAPEDERLVHFKFEPMILHVLTASPAHAQLLLRCASMAGFRESGAVSIVAPPMTAAGKADDSGSSNAAMPIVAVRSMGLALASVVGVAGAGADADDDNAAPRCIVAPSYLSRLVHVADERFAVNRARTERFRAALVAAVGGSPAPTARSTATLLEKGGDAAWEDADARRARKREEGLRRQAALKAQQDTQDQAREDDGSGQVSKERF